MKYILSYFFYLVHKEHNFNLLNKVKKPFLISLCTFLSVLVITRVGFYSNVTLLIPPIAASCVIIFTSPHSDFARTKNILLGHVISSAIAISILHLLGNTAPSYAIALSLSIFLMLITDTLHPPAGATAILIIATNAKWYFIFFPVSIGAVLLCGISIGYRQLHKFIKLQNK